MNVAESKLKKIMDFLMMQERKSLFAEENVAVTKSTTAQPVSNTQMENNAIIPNAQNKPRKC